VAAELAPLAENAVIHRFPSAIHRKPVFSPVPARYRHIILSRGGSVENQTSYAWRRQLVWGLVVIALGLAFLLDQMDVVEIRAIWHYWPLLLVALGLNRMIGYPTPKEFTSGLTTMLFGLLFFALFEGMFGLTWRNFWPFAIIIGGLGMVIEPLMKQRFESNEEPRNEK
jgi:hypothetical protein